MPRRAGRGREGEGVEDWEGIVPTIPAPAPSMFHVIFILLPTTFLKFINFFYFILRSTHAHTSHFWSCSPGWSRILHVPVSTSILACWLSWCLHTCSWPHFVRRKRELGGLRSRSLLHKSTAGVPPLSGLSTLPAHGAGTSACSSRSLCPLGFRKIALLLF